MKSLLLLLIISLAGCSNENSSEETCFSNKLDAPYLTSDCCSDVECKKKVWCGVTKVKKGEGKFVILETNKSIIEGKKKRTNP